MPALPNSPDTLPPIAAEGRPPGTGWLPVFALQALLSFIGAGIAGTLWWAHRANIDLPCTGDGRGCDLVAQSRWAHISLGPWPDIPIALAGLCAYVCLLALSLAKMGAETPRGLRRLQIAFALLCSGGTTWSWYLQYVAHFRIGAFCVWCFSSACVMTLLFVSVLWEARRSASETP